MTKPTKWHVRPAKTQISLGIRPVWSESSMSAWGKLRSLATLLSEQRRLGGCPGWSESSLGAKSFCWFCHEAAHFWCLNTHNLYSKSNILSDRLTLSVVDSSSPRPRLLWVRRWGGCHLEIQDVTALKAHLVFTFCGITKQLYSDKTVLILALENEFSKIINI